MNPSLKSQKKLDKKSKRHQHTLCRTANVTCLVTPTKHIGICNVGQINGLTEEILYESFYNYGPLDQILLLPGKSCAFVSYRSVSDAVQAFEACHSKLNIGQDNKPIYLAYVQALPEVTDRKHYNKLPKGLQIIENAITVEEEQQLLSLCNFNDDDGSMRHRQVKHFGYEFRYDINNVDKDKPLPNPIPEKCLPLLQRLNLDFCPDQLTVNRYKPGQGIPAHIDTHSAFEDPILSLSLNSAVIMEFKRGSETLCVLLPQRSLAIMRGESRYDWTHAIIPRKYDFYYTAQGCKCFKRGTRISFTFRKVLRGDCKCEYKLNCDSQNTSEIGASLSAKLEQMYVHQVYEDIAGHFSETRHKPWPKIMKFVEELPLGAVLLDVGCGNGKYFGVNKNTIEVGLDTSTKLVEVCKLRGFEVFCGNCVSLPIKDNFADGVISIAVIHHLSTEDRRLLALSEIVRVLRPGGQALVYVWSKQQIKDDEKSTYIKQDRKNWKGDATNEDQEKETILDGLNLPVHTNRTNFNHSDILVPWKCKNKGTGPKDTQTFLRFYHVFEQGEIEELCRRIEGVEVLEGYYDQGNYCVKLKKIELY